MVDISEEYEELTTIIKEKLKQKIKANGYRKVTGATGLSTGKTYRIMYSNARLHLDDYLTLRKYLKENE